MKQEKRKGGRSFCRQYDTSRTQKNSESRTVLVDIFVSYNKTGSVRVLLKHSFLPCKIA
jgi:hypothetical protein